MTDVVTLGETMVLFQPSSQGKITDSQYFLKSIGGAESNVALALARLNHPVRWISKLGNDPFGKLILRTLQAENVNVEHVITDSENPTAVFFKEARPLRDPAVYYYRKHSAASHLSIDDFDDQWLLGARHLHMTGITPALSHDTFLLTEAIMKRARELGLTVSFDPNIRFKLWSKEEAKEKLLRLLPYSTIFMPGEDELAFLYPEVESTEDAIKQIHELGVDLIVIKKGEQGSYASLKGKTIVKPAFKIEHVIDSVGAGDAFCAGLLHELLKGDLKNITLSQLELALVTANTMGAYATQFKGDWEGAPTEEELNDLLGKSTLIDR